MAVVRCLGCGELFEAKGGTVACPLCGTVMRVTSEGAFATPPPGVGGAAPGKSHGQPVSVILETPHVPEGDTVGRPASSGPWLSSTAKIWIGAAVALVLFGLFIDWFRMKIQPTKKVVDQAQVEKLAHDIAEEKVNELAVKLEEARASTQKATPPPPIAASPMAPRVEAGTTGAPLAAVTNPVPAAPVVPVATKPALVVRNPAYAVYARLTPGKPKEVPDAGVTDAQIDLALRKGLDWFVDQFSKYRLKNVESYDPAVFGGANAISVYALLAAGQAIKDERVGGNTTLVKNLLDGLKEIPLEGGKDTYARSLRISALTLLNRREDRATIEADVRWLLDSSMQGAFGYTKPSPGQQRSSGGWDNSNSQYGALGLWAASEAGFRVPTQFWKDVEAHWMDGQVKISGGWGYSPGNGGPATVAMTCAGANMLMVARDLMTVEGSSLNVTAPLSKPLERALEWLDEGEHTVNFHSHFGYTVYGLERVGLASGYKFFGKHDWYRELSKKVVDTQGKDGSWDGTDGAAPETAFRLLFLARGREPVFVGKLRWDGNWSNRPRDVAGLTKFASRATERTLNWQVLGLQRDWTDWTDAPVMLITSEDGPTLTDAEVAKLRSYALAGGLVFTHVENGAAGMNAVAEDLARRMFPEYPMTPLPAGHGIYSAMFPVRDGAVRLSGVSNGSRLLMVHSASDLTKQWGARAPASEKERVKTGASEMGVNVVVWATGRRDLRRRTDPAYVAERPEKPVGTIPVARLKYDGNWDPEPWGWVRAARKFDRETGIGLEVRPTEIVALEPGTTPVAHLTGTKARTFTDAEVKVVREYAQGGGVLLVDACGGSAEFAESVRTNLIARAFPNQDAAPVTAAHPLMGRGRAWMGEIEKLLNGLRVLTAGSGAVVFTDMDISTGLLGTTVLGVRGYEPSVAERLVQNLVVWAVWPEGAPALPEAEKK